MNNEEPILPQLQGKTLMIPSILPSQESFQELQQSFDKPKLDLRDILSKTWEELDKQQVFDQIAGHLLTQSRKSHQSYNGCAKFRCAYRGDEGLKCAIGALISDEEYKPTMETKSVASLAVEFFPSPLLDKGVTDFLQTFQTIHDSWEVTDWKYKLSTIPQKYVSYSSINTDILDQFTWNEGEQRYVRQ
jgi:hypothetical protein